MIRDNPGLVSNISNVIFEGEIPDEFENFDSKIMGTFNDGIIIGFIRGGPPIRDNFGKQDGTIYQGLRERGPIYFKGGVDVKPKPTRNF